MGPGSVHSLLAGEAGPVVALTSNILTGHKVVIQCHKSVLKSWNLAFILDASSVFNLRLFLDCVLVPLIFVAPFQTVFSF